MREMGRKSRANVERVPDHIETDKIRLELRNLERRGKDLDRQPKRGIRNNKQKREENLYSEERTYFFMFCMYTANE